MMDFCAQRHGLLAHVLFEERVRDQSHVVNIRNAVRQECEHGVPQADAHTACAYGPVLLALIG